MARYNQWQNNGLRDHVKVMSEEELRQDRGAFFGSILATIDHIMWADRLWLNRLDPAIAAPGAPADAAAEISVADWLRDREALDDQIIVWAEGLSEADMAGDVVWASQIYGKTFTNARPLAITHFFNHQTHHRGQVHAMLTAMGRATIDTDLVFMPEN